MLDELSNQALKGEHRFDLATLTTVTGYINNRSPSLQTQSPVLGQPAAGQGAINLGLFQTAKTFSQELQLTSNAEGPFRWITGLFYYSDKTMIQTQVYGTCVGTACTTPVPTQTNGFQDTKSYSAYAEGTYDLTESTHLTLGIRYTSDHKTLDGTSRPLPGFPNSPSVPPGTVLSTPNTIDTSVTFNKLTYKAVLAQDITDDIHAYASLNRGFKSGGYNPTGFTNPASRPEVLDAYELGLKSELFGRALRLNASAFYYDYKDIQLRTTAPPAPPGGTILFNAAAAHIKGIDVDFVIVPTRGLTFTGGFEILDAQYTRFPAGICTTPRPIGGAVLGGTASATCNLSGYRLPQAPKFSFSLGLTYHVETPLGGFEFSASDGYKSKFAWESDNRLQQKSYHLINASLTWLPTDSQFSLQVFGRNLGSKYYFVSASNAGGNDGHIPGAPRTYGVRARYNF